jgi:hypothetical protein
MTELDAKLPSGFLEEKGRERNFSSYPGKLLRRKISSSRVHQMSTGKNGTTGRTLSAHRALEEVLQTYAAIGILVALQAADGAVNAVVSALKVALPAVASL